MFDEQVGWIVEAGMDFVIAETFSYGEEALIALEAIRRTGLPAVVTLAIHRNGLTREGVLPEEACARLEDAGAAVVGLNCLRGPRTMLPLLSRIRERVSGPVAALPVPYRTWSHQPTMHSLSDPERSAMPFPTGLDPFFCTRDEMGEFASQAHEAGIDYLGVCCGCGPQHIRSMAEALGRRPAASRYSTDMSKHAFLGSDPTLKHTNLAMASGL
jgi:betaine-homocysteine S-methyltransferase